MQGCPQVLEDAIPLFSVPHLSIRKELPPGCFGRCTNYRVTESYLRSLSPVNANGFRRRKRHRLFKILHEFNGSAVWGSGRSGL